MTRKLIVVDLALALALAGLSWQLRGEWVAARNRELAFRQQTIKPTPLAPLAPLPKLAPLTAAAYAPVAEKNLFSRDRNPNVVVDPVVPPTPKQVPPFPVARGVMLWEGVPPTVLLSDKPGGNQKGYHPGDKIGEWKIESVDNQYLVLEWDGKQFKKRLDELLDKTPIMVAEAPPSSAGSNAPAPAAKPLAGNGPSSPGPDVGGGHNACVPGDNSPSGTVANGMKKVVAQTPFGASCFWEQAK